MEQLRSLLRLDIFMGDKTSIEWTATVHPDGSVTPGATWNPTRGCDPVSPGCAHCYAERVAARFSGPGKPYEGVVDEHGKWNGVLKLVEEHLEDPLRWKKPRRIFVDSMSDLFHENVPDAYLDKVFAVMAIARQHTFQVLTKRADRMLAYMVSRSKSAQFWKDAARTVGYALEFDGISLVSFPLPNVWLGVSVENQAMYDKRIGPLLRTPAAVRFLSVEPMLGPVDLRMGGMSLPDYAPHNPLPDVDWIIVGGESGQGARPFNLAWARSIIAQCAAAKVPVFMKQLGKMPYEGTDPYVGGPDAANCKLYELDIDKGHGGDPVEWPWELRVREFPSVGRA